MKCANISKKKGAVDDSSQRRMQEICLVRPRLGGRKSTKIQSDEAAGAEERSREGLPAAPALGRKEKSLAMARLFSFPTNLRLLLWFFSFWTSDVDGHWATIQHLTVHLVDCCLSFFWCGHNHKTKALGAARHTVTNYLCRFDGAECGEGALQALVCGCPGNTTNEELVLRLRAIFFCHSFTF